MPALNLNRTHDGLQYVELTLHGHPRKFIVDTGASYSIIAPHLLTDACLKAGKALRSHGVGEATVLIVRTKFRLLGKEITKFATAEFLYGHGFDGLIGQDILSQFQQVIFDNKNKILRLTP